MVVGNSESQTRLYSLYSPPTSSKQPFYYTRNKYARKPALCITEIHFQEGKNKERE